MSLLTIRGGVPDVLIGSPDDTTGLKHTLPATSNYIRITASAACKVYFTLADFNADVNYVVVSPLITGSNPWEGPAEVDSVWFRAVTGKVDIVCVAFQRRG